MQEAGLKPAELKREFQANKHNAKAQAGHRAAKLSVERSCKQRSVLSFQAIAGCMLELRFKVADDLVLQVPHLPGEDFSYYGHCVHGASWIYDLRTGT